MVMVEATTSPRKTLVMARSRRVARALGRGRHGSNPGPTFLHHLLLLPTTPLPTTLLYIRYMSNSNVVEPPPPLKLDPNAIPETEDPLVVRRKKSGLQRLLNRRTSKASSLKSTNVSRRKSRLLEDDEASLQTDGAGPSSEPDGAYGPRIIDGESVSERRSRGSISQGRPSVDVGTEITVAEEVRDGEQAKDLYRWAVMYENQRG